MSPFRKGIESSQRRFVKSQALLQSGHLADLALKVKTEVLQVHSVVLAARSPVFERMLSCRALSVGLVCARRSNEGEGREGDPHRGAVI